MISLYQLKPKFQQLLRPLVKKLFLAKVTANQVTLSACLGSIFIAGIVAFFANQVWIFGLIPIWMLIRMALNAIDGMLAREFNQQSDLGAYFNELCDVIADTALLGILAFIVPVNSLFVLLLIFLALLTEYAGVMGPLIGASRRYDGPMGKSDRALVLGIICLAIAIGWLPLDWVNMLLWIIIFLLIYTIFNRIKHALKEVATNK